MFNYAMKTFMQNLLEIEVFHIIYTELYLLYEFTVTRKTNN